MKLITCIKNNILVVRHDMNVEKMNKEKNNDFKEIRNVGVIIDIKFKEKMKTFINLSLEISIATMVNWLYNVFSNDFKCEVHAYFM